MDFTDKLQSILEKKGITAYRLCKDIGIAPNSLNNWKKGSLPTVDKFEKIIIYLDIEPEELLNIKNREKFVTVEEQALLEAYRSATPAMQAAARKLLDLPETETERSSCSRTG